jgi:PAS domain S-box-containing protein
MCKPEQGIIKDDVQYEAESCVYEVQWQPLRSWYQRLRDNLLGRMFPVSVHVQELENNFRQVDQKNAELVERNKQLAAVREIAIGVDNVRTIDEALSLAVEHAREIEGIRFVLVQRLDEAGEFVITPYYSKIRNTYASNALKALGFDPKKVLGSNPTSKKLRFRFSKLKAAQDYRRNPRVMVFPTLAELLDGVWPRTLCDSIQKILRVKKLVIVPLMIEGESWGNLLYFLTREVPTDILEMIGTHCAIAIRNIGYTVTLAEEAVRRRILIDQSQDGIVVLDQDGHVYESNQKFAEMLGYSPEEVRELSVWDWEFLFPREKVVEMVRTVDENGDHFQTQHRRKDGSIYDVEISTNGAIFSGQKLIFCVCRDITEHKKMDEALRESEEKYRTVFESAYDILLLMDNKGKIIDVNGRVEDVGGYNREEILGKNLRALSKIMTKKSLAIVAKNYLKRMAGLNVPFYDIVLFKKNGEPVDIQVSAMAIRKEGKIVGDLAILRDVTELKQAEKNLKLQKDLIDRIIATIPNAVLLLDENLQIILANKAFCDLFELKKSKVEGKYMKELIAAPDLDEAIAEILSGKEVKASTEFRYSIASSKKILFTSMFTMKEGNLLLVINDITEEREKQERLYLTDRLASVGEMASGVAHELNNPLTSIIGLSSLLTRQEMPPETKEDLEAIHAEAQRCAAIVKNLLAFARKHAPKREPIQITRILEDVLKLRAYEQRGQNITIETNFTPDLPEVFADYFQMQQVFLNLILNAETAMVDAHGRGTLKITTQRDNGHIDISFEDDGPGITKENLRVIFNPFFTTKEVGKGTGLGLSICYGIVASHGGKIYTRGPSGKGATFVVELPTVSN